MHAVVIETLGDLERSGMGLRVFCGNDSCDRELADLPRLIETFGPNQVYVGGTFRMRCAVCDSRRFRLSVIADQSPAACANEHFRSAWYDGAEEPSKRI